MSNRADSSEVQIRAEFDIVTVRRISRDVATELGFGVTDVTRIVTTASELARNIYNYAGWGVMKCSILTANNKVGIELTFEDHGPGIPDIQQAMEVGYTTGGGLGMGLPGAKRLMGEMEIESEVGQGTKVTVRKWRNR